MRYLVILWSVRWWTSSIRWYKEEKRKKWRRHLNWHTYQKYCCVMSIPNNCILPLVCVTIDPSRLMPGEWTIWTETVWKLFVCQCVPAFVYVPHHFSCISLQIFDRQNSVTLVCENTVILLHNIKSNLSALSANNLGAFPSELSVVGIYFEMHW